MIPTPNNRAVQSGDSVTRSTPVVGANRQSATVQAHRAIATVRDILGRDPKARVMTGGTRLIVLPDK